MARQLRHYLLALFILTLVTEPNAQPAFSQWQVAPEITQLFGHTTYTLDVSDADSRVVSKLEFPLEHLLVGGRISYRIFDGYTTTWQLDAGARFSVGAPSGLMTDTDWEYSAGGFNGVWSYTESDPHGNFLDLHVRATRTFWQGANASLGLTGGVRYLRSYQEIDNFTGYQLTGPNQTANEVAVTNLPAITYEVSYLMPELGLAGQLSLSPALHLEPAIVYSRVWAEDRDDHLLRSKLSTGDGWGNALSADLGMTVRFPAAQSNHSYELALAAGLTTIHINGVQDQVFYEAVTEYDPVTGQHIQIPAGFGYDNLPHEFSSTQYSLSARFGLTF